MRAVVIPTGSPLCELEVSDISLAKYHLRFRV